MHTSKLFSFVIGALLLTAALPGTSMAAAESPVEDVFVGTAVTGVGQASPVDVVPSDVTVRASDHAIGLGYVYRASGRATGEIVGKFDYVEHGYLFFKNPADPTTYLGGVYSGGSFTLTPANPHRAPITIVDTDPAAYRSGVLSMPVPGGHGAVGAYEAGLRKLGLLESQQSTINYGYFTFTDKYGSQTGYSTPDFRSFAIRLKFDA